MIRIVALIALLLFAAGAQAQGLRAEPRIQPPASGPAAAAAKAHASPGRVFPLTLLPPSADELGQLAAPSKGTPLQVGFGREVAALQSEAGLRGALSWETLPTGCQVAALSIDSPGAAASRVALRVSSLPPGTVLRFYGDPNGKVYEVGGEKVLQAIARNVASGDASPEASTYYSPRLEGEKATVELEIPPGARPQDLHIAIPAISHFVSSAKQGFAVPKVGNPGGSGACENDVMCSPAWGVERQAVALMDFCEKTKCFWCTGTLLADTDPSSTIPFFQSANHCISTQTVASTLETDWFFQSTTCNSGVVDPGMVALTGGATLLYATPNTDTSFMQLNDAAPAGAAFAGWIADAVVPVSTPITGIHHPAGDLTKISFGNIQGYYTCTAQSHGGGFTCSSATAGAATFYGVTWNDGVTEGGSSGSAIWDNAGQYVRGQLYGGSSSCTNVGATDYYGRFDVAFNAATNKWLAPPLLQSVASRKFHAGAGSFDLPIDASAPIGGAISVEPRIAGPSGHSIVFTFDKTVTSPGTAISTGVDGSPLGIASPMAGANEVTVVLSGIPVSTRVKVTLTGTNGSLATYFASIGLLVGDDDSSRAVNSADVDGVKAYSGLTVDAGDFRHDLNLSGAVTASDILIAKGRVGLSI